MIKTEVYQKRWQGVRQYLREKGLDGVLFTSYENRRYYSGFTGSLGYLLITEDNLLMVVDKRYTLQASQQTTQIQVIEYLTDRFQAVAEMIKKAGVTRLVMETCLTLEEYFPLKEKLDNIELFYEQEYFLEKRMIKDEQEILLTKAAIRCAEDAFGRLLPQLKIGMTEKDIADELAYLANKAGADGLSFDTIVGSGARGALAHAYPTAKKIEDGDMVVVDFGVFKDGYCSDMTRTLLFGDVSKEHKRIFDLVKEAQDSAFEAIRPGVLAKEVEDAHRAVFIREGLDSFALRGLGHGIGLQIHECPRIVIGNETVLRPGMIFTVEPGLYFPEDCGARTEDDVLVTEDGFEDLSNTPREIYVG